MKNRMHRYSLLASVLIFLVIPSQACGADKTSPKSLLVGAMDVIDLDFDPFVPNVPKIHNPEYIRLDTGKNARQLIVVGIKKGESTVELFDALGKMRRKLSYRIVGKNSAGKRIAPIPLSPHEINLTDKELEKLREITTYPMKNELVNEPLQPAP